MPRRGSDPTDDPYMARYLLEELGLTGEEEPSRLSGGEARRAALARALAAEPDMLLLDEPTNHLDLPAIEWLEKRLASVRSALVLISHDRRFLQTLTRATVWLDRGRTRRLEQGFGAFETWRDEVLEQEERDLHKLDRKIVEEEHWITHGVTARRKRNMRRVGELAELRQERRDARRVTGSVKMEATEGKVSGKLVIEAERISKSYGERAIVTDFSTRILRGDRVGIVGPNGAGKTTLINLLTGALAPDEGHVRLGANLEIASLDQKRHQLRPEWTLKEALTGGGGDWVEINGVRKHVIGYMKDFLFAPEQARQPVTKLSGGERGRLALARALSMPSNLLVLDEPTNDLDLETLDLLQEMLNDYPGTVIVVSHDRDFLDRIVTSVIVSEGEGRWLEYAGGYSDMVAQRGFGVLAPATGEQSGAGKTAARPRRARKAGATHRPASCRSSRSTRSKRCPAAWTKCARSPPASARSSKTPSSTRATPPVSPSSRTPSRRRSAASPPPRRNGWSWKCCARRSRVKAQRAPCSFFARAATPCPLAPLPLSMRRIWRPPFCRTTASSFSARRPISRPARC